jgi:cytochrome oxidase Cu insertion factor (SCO1/SenC/PrrC family)
LRFASLRAILVFLVGLLGFQAQGQTARLGPKDGAGLAPTDTGRVTVGGEAPDFTLEALVGPPVTLSQFRVKQNVVLVFYRGHW